MFQEEYLDNLYKTLNEKRKAQKPLSTLILLRCYLKHRDGNPFDWFIYGDLLRVLGRYKEAEQALLKSLQNAREEKKITIYRRLAILFSDAGRFEEAEQYFLKGANRQSAKDPGWLWILRGKNLAYQGNFIMAEDCFRHALTLNEVDKDEAYLSLGYMLRAQEKYPEAVTAFKECLKIEPAEAKAQEALRELENLDEDIARADGLTCEGRWDDLYKLIKDAFLSKKQSIVIILLPRYLKHRVDRAYAWYMYGDVLRIVGRFQVSEQVFLKSLEIASEEQISGVYSRLAKLYSDYGKYEKAEECYLRITKDVSYENLGWIWLERGLNLAKYEQFPSAESCFRTALTLEEVDKKEVYLYLGYVLRTQEKYKEAAEALAEYSKIVPEDSKVEGEISELQEIDKIISLANNVPADDSD